MGLTDHFGAQPSDVIDAIIALLDDFTCMKTVKRMVGGSESGVDIDTMLTAGTPAFVVAHVGGSFVRRSTNSRRFDQDCRVKIFCVSSYQRTQVSRAASSTPTVNPGAEDLADWATYYAVRAIEGVSGASAPRPIGQRWVLAEPSKYIVAVDIGYTRQLDCWDDDPTTELETLGLVRDPSDSTMFENDNVTPDSDDPAEFDGGVYTL